MLELLGLLGLLVLLCCLLWLLGLGLGLGRFFIFSRRQNLEGIKGILIQVGEMVANKHIYHFCQAVGCYHKINTLLHSHMLHNLDGYQCKVHIID